MTWEQSQGIFTNVSFMWNLVEGEIVHLRGIGLSATMQNLGGTRRTCLCDTYNHVRTEKALANGI